MCLAGKAPVPRPQEQGQQHSRLSWMAMADIRYSRLVSQQCSVHVPLHPDQQHAVSCRCPAPITKDSCRVGL